MIGGASRHGYHEDQGGAGICRGGGGGYGGGRRWRERESRVEADDGEGMIW